MPKKKMAKNDNAARKNARERERYNCVKNMIEKLCTHIPGYSTNESKASKIRRILLYLRFLDLYYHKLNGEKLTKFGTYEQFLLSKTEEELQNDCHNKRSESAHVVFLNGHQHERNSNNSSDSSVMQCAGPLIELRPQTSTSSSNEFSNRVEMHDNNAYSPYFGATSKNYVQSEASMAWTDESFFSVPIENWCQVSCSYQDSGHKHPFGAESPKAPVKLSNETLASPMKASSNYQCLPRNEHSFVSSHLTMSGQGSPRSSVYNPLSKAFSLHEQNVHQSPSSEYNLCRSNDLAELIANTEVPPEYKRNELEHLVTDPITDMLYSLLIEIETQQDLAELPQNCLSKE